MKLTQDEYKALEDIVGPEYITQEPVIMESYCQLWGNKLAFGDKRHNPPAAVLMPTTPAVLSYPGLRKRYKKSSASATRPAFYSRPPPGPSSTWRPTWAASGASSWS